MMSAHPHSGITISKAKIQLAQPYINNEQQSEGPSGRHSRVDQSGISTAISKANAYLAQLYINSDQQSKTPQAQPRPRFFLQSENTTGPAVYQQQAAKRKHFWTTHPCRPERYINRDHRNENISGTAVYQQQSAERKHI